MLQSIPTLPIVEALPALAEALLTHSRIVLEAPPGAGKSTYLPLWLLQRGGDRTHRIVLIQPRRLAAATVANYLARQTGKPLGQIVGLRTRFDHKMSAETVIEVVTEGIFLRQVQRDPELSGVATVLFDEYHERSWQADLALGLALESQAQWRPSELPLTLIVMSATLPVDAVASWLNATAVRAAGRSYPVTLEYDPLGRAELIDHLAQTIRAALRDGARRILVFLAGWQIMQRVRQRLSGADCDVLMLHSSVAPEEQQRAMQFDPEGGQSVILATNIAETSVTIPGVDTVIDSGQVRRAIFDPRRGMDRLETGWISRASAEQRAGRAGRLGPGRCIRLWSQEQHGRLLAHDAPEIQQVDLTPLAMELALWGGDDIATVLPEPPPPQRLSDARQLLQRLDAVDASFRITATGRAMAELGLHPRLGRLVLAGQAANQLREACLLAALLSEGDFVRGASEHQVDLDWRLQLLNNNDGKAGDIQYNTLQRIKQLARQLQTRCAASSTTGAAALTTGALLLAAFPDRLARRRQPESKRYLCIDGFEVLLADHDALGRSEWLVVAEHDGDRRGARIRFAAAIDVDEIEPLLTSQVQIADSVRWDDARNALVAQRQQRLGALVLSERSLPVDDEHAAQFWLQQLRERGLDWLAWSGSVAQWLGRARWLAPRVDAWPDFSETALLADLEQWFAPYLAGVRKLSALQSLDFAAMLRARLDYSQQQQMNRLAPEAFELPTGIKHRIAYSADTPPRLAARLTEFYGLDQHPQVNGEPLLLELLSPGRRPLQLTQDLPGFWRGAYVDVRKEMKGRYPKHFWPEQPWLAPATATTKKHMKSFEE
ncbi:MAG: ATP-dependent helicase HrpB [Verrucomicrobiaceae bacterium]|nr:ATP-dependent helicase HrpB [Verrucomicrobiaceae bacterium]